MPIEEIYIMRIVSPYFQIKKGNDVETKALRTKNDLQSTFTQDLAYKKIKMLPCATMTAELLKSEQRQIMVKVKMLIEIKAYGNTILHFKF